MKLKHLHTTLRGGDPGVLLECYAGVIINRRPATLI